MTGIEIKKLRKHLKMSRREFGIKIGEVLEQKPIIHTTIYRWENDKVKRLHGKFTKALKLIKNDYDNFHKVKLIVERGLNG